MPAHNPSFRRLPVKKRAPSWRRGLLLTLAVTFFALNAPPAEATVPPHEVAIEEPSGCVVLVALNPGYTCEETAAIWRLNYNEILTQAEGLVSEGSVVAVDTHDAYSDAYETYAYADATAAPITGPVTGPVLGEVNRVTAQVYGVLCDNDLCVGAPSAPGASSNTAQAASPGMDTAPPGSSAGIQWVADDPCGVNAPKGYVSGWSALGRTTRGYRPGMSPTHKYWALEGWATGDGKGLWRRTLAVYMSAVNKADTLYRYSPQQVEPVGTPSQRTYGVGINVEGVSASMSHTQTIFPAAYGGVAGPRNKSYLWGWTGKENAARFILGMTVWRIPKGTVPEIEVNCGVVVQK